MKHKKILVTGGSGFLGKHLVNLLNISGYEAVSLSSKDVDLTLPLGKNMIEKMFVDIGSCIHLAADSDVKTSLQYPSQNILKNTTLLVNILESIRISGRMTPILFASTDRMYGANTAATARESSSIYPLEPYTASKMIGEVILESYKHLYNIPYIAYRIDSIYGPGQPDRMFISNIINKMIKDNKISVGDLSVYKNFVYVTDVALAFISGLEANSQAWNTCYNIGGTPSSLSQIANIIKVQIEKRQNKKIELVFDQNLTRTKGAEVNLFTLDTNKAKRVLGWSPKVLLEEGLKLTVNSFIDHHEK